MALEDRLRNEKLPSEAIQPDEDITSKLQQPQSVQQGSELEQKIDKDRFTIGRGIKDLFKFSPLALAAYYVVQGTFTPILTISGFVLANIIEAKKKKEKVRYKALKKDITTATVTGMADYWFWTLPGLVVPNATLAGKVARTLFAMPVLAIAYLYPYNQYLYFRDNVGLKGTVKSLFNGKFFYHLSEARKYSSTQVKPQLKRLVPLYPSYFLGMNYLTNIYHRIMVSVFNNLFFRLFIIGKKHDAAEKKTDREPLHDRIKGLYKNIPQKLDNFFRHPDYKPVYGGSY